MKLILDCHSSEDDHCDCDYAFLDLTPELAHSILKKHEAFLELRKKTDAYEAQWFEYCVTYFHIEIQGRPITDDEKAPLTNEDNIEAAVGDLGGEDLWTRVGEEVTIPEDWQARTECDQILVREDSIQFTCFPKHTDVVITTANLPLPVIRRVAARGDVPVSKHPDDILKGLDTELFKKQRSYLIELAHRASVGSKGEPHGETMSQTDADLIEGANNLLDTLADYAHDVLGLDVLLTEEGEEEANGRGRKGV